MAAHNLKTWTKRRWFARGYAALGGRREFHARCECGWEAKLTSRADRKIEVGKHREVARWTDRSAAKPYGASTRT